MSNFYDKNRFYRWGIGTHWHEGWYPSDSRATRSAARWTKLVWAKARKKYAGSIHHYINNDPDELVEVYRYASYPRSGVIKAQRPAKIAQFEPDAAYEWDRPRYKTKTRRRR